MNGIEIECSGQTDTFFDVDGGTDIDVEVKHGGRSWKGVVTLIRDEVNHCWSTWGAPDNWASQELLDAVSAIAGDSGEDSDIYSLIGSEAAAYAA